MERTLFVFEGQDREKQYFESLERAFFLGKESRILVCFQNDIYELYKELASDEDLDPFTLIKELNPVAKNREDLATLRRDQIGQIYLFFDMEPCDDQFHVEKLLELLSLFDNETENGKLFISYPMVEAIRDIDDLDEFLTRTASLNDCVGRRYKRLSAERGHQGYQDAKRIRKSDWQDLIAANLKKANGLTTGYFTSHPVVDLKPFTEMQLDEYLPNEKVAVLSAFPIFLADYFGEAVLD